MSQSRETLVAPLTATALIAQQVGSNAIRDGLFLSWFPVTRLPYLIAAAALLSIPAAQGSGRLLTRFGPARVVPALLGISGLLFFLEWALLTRLPQPVAILLYLHSSVLGAIAISSYWSLLNERFDPHSAKPLMAKVAAATTFGGLLGGVGAERVVALLSQSALLVILGVVATTCVAGAILLSRGMPVRRREPPAPAEHSGWRGIWSVELLRNLATVVVLAALLAALVDYVMKAEAAAYFGKGGPLVRFFGLFYAGTGVAAFLLQATAGQSVLSRFGLAGSVSVHPAAVGAAALLRVVIPAPWGGVLPRGCDVALRASVFRAGYELLYTPLAEATKRSAKSIIDVAGDCLGKGAGAVLILLLTLAGPAYALVAINVAAVLAAAAEFFIARRLRAGYVHALEGGLRRQGEDLVQAAQYSLSDFTMVEGGVGADRDVLLRALNLQPASVGDAPAPAGPPPDPVVAAILDLRSDNPRRVRNALRDAPKDPLLIAALIPLLAKRDILREVMAALAVYGPRAAGQIVDALLDPDTPDAVRRRLPLVLKSCASPVARDGLILALASSSFEVRLRSARALLALTDDHPELVVPPQTALTEVERELAQGGEHERLREHLFNLLALGLEREPVRIAARAFESGDQFVRGTAFEYLETVLPPSLFAALKPRLDAAARPAPQPRPPRTPDAVRADLLRAGATMVMSLEEIRKQLAESRSLDES